MSLIDLLLDALSLPWPSKDERVRRYERIGCLVGIVAGLLVTLVVAITSFGSL